MGNNVGSEEVMALRQEVSDLKGDIAELKTMMTAPKRNREAEKHHLQMA